MVFHVQLADVICTDDPTLNCHDLVLTAFICVNEDVTVIVGKYTSDSCRDVNILQQNLSHSYLPPCAHTHALRS